MIIFGSRATNIGSFESNGICDYCKNKEMQHFVVYGRYFHIFWIPFFPIGRKVFSECTHCKKTIAKKNFPPEVLQQYNHKKGEVKRPFWHWTGLILIGSLVLFIALAGKAA